MDANMDSGSLLEKAVILDLRWHMPGRNRRGNLTSVDTDADKTLLGLSKRIYNCEGYTKAQQVKNDLKDWLKRHSLPGSVLKLCCWQNAERKRWRGQSLLSNQALVHENLFCKAWSVVRSHSPFTNSLQQGWGKWLTSDDLFTIQPVF